MNEAGKGLENHEILKVRLLKKLGENDFDQCTKIWNMVSQMDKCLVRQKEKELVEDFKKRIFNAFANPFQVLAHDKDSVQQKSDTISNIKAVSNKPATNVINRDEGAILDFQEFLLLVLALTMDSVSTGFDKNKLLKSFEALGDEQKLIKSFFDNLLKYRLLFDYFIIRTTSTDGRTTTYSLNYSNSLKQALIHYQSMLNVSTSYNIWLIPLMKELDKISSDEKAKDFKFLDFLKTWDNERHGGEIHLNYGSISRYWFWRLDYYLWERRDELFESKAKEIANHYVFRPNRSIEHIAPQTPKSNSSVNLKESLLHTFGNLAMISSGQNSSLQNESYEIKKAYIASFINGSVGGSIESLKMLKIFEFETWNEENVKKHHDDMIEIFITSFDKESLKKALKKLKFHNESIPN